MEDTRLFRSLIVASVVLYAIWFFFPYAENYFLSQESLDILSGAGYKAQIIVDPWVFYISFAVFILASLLMYFFVAIGRSIFIWFSLFWLIAICFLGIQIETGLSRSIGTVVTMLDGVIIYMAYFSDVERYFGGEDVQQT